MLMKRPLAVLSVLCLLGAAGLVAWASFSRPTDLYLATDSARAFDLKTAPADARAAPAPEVHDAVAAPASPRPIPAAGMEKASRGAPGPSPRSAKAEVRARRDGMFAALLRAPARFLASRTVLGRPSDLRAFLSDRRAVDSFMNGAVVRAVLARPAFAKTVLGRPALVRAFLESAAMRDPAAVRVLLSSRMVAKMLDCPGVQAALADPGVAGSMTADPATARWLAENPAAMTVLGASAPALAAAVR
jgi:hypothetical protein